MRILHLLVIFFLFSFFSVNAQDGKYSGKIIYGNSFLDYQIELKQDNGNLKVFFSSPEMNAYKIPCLNATLKNDTLNFYVVSDYFTYEYNYRRLNNQFKGRLSIYANETDTVLYSFETSLIKDETDIADIDTEEISFPSNGLNLKGTLWKPKKPNNKYLFFVTSSQGSDRSSSGAEAFYFAKIGYTVFHYDKRGTGQSEGNWKSASIEELADDDINALQYLSKTNQFQLSKTGIIGSSQGGIKIPYILFKLPELQYGISVSCPGGSLLESDLTRWKNSNIKNIGKENIKNALKIQEAGYGYMAGLINYKKLKQLINRFKNEVWFKYIELPDEKIDSEKDVVPSTFSGIPYFKKIKQPVLVIQGLSDNVIPKDSYKEIERALLKSGNNHFKIITLDKATHSMTVSDDRYPYFQKLHPDYLPDIMNWIQGLN